MSALRAVKALLINSLLPEGARSTLPPSPRPTVSSSHAALAATTFWDVYSLPSDLICYLSVEHGDELAMNPSLRLASITYFLAERSPIHRSAWNKNSRKFAVTSGRRYGFQGCRSLCTLAPPARFKAKLIAFVARNCYKPLRLATAQLT